MDQSFTVFEEGLYDRKDIEFERVKETMQGKHFVEDYLSADTVKRDKEIVHMGKEVVGNDCCSLQ